MIRAGRLEALVSALDRAAARFRADRLEALYSRLPDFAGVLDCRGRLPSLYGELGEEKRGS